MLTGVSMVCFTASYAVALALEVSRLFFKSGIRGAVMLFFAVAGLVAHTWYLALLAYESPAGAVPLSSWFHWYLVAAWILASAYLYLVFYHVKNPIGLFILPLVLGLVGVSWLFRDDRSVAAARASETWLLVHIVSLLLGTVVVLIGFVAGVMYLVQAWRLKHKRPVGRLRLPSLEWSEKVNSRALVISTLLVGVGVVAGLLRNADLLRGGGAGAIPWGDPVIVSSVLLIGWLIVATVFNALYRPARVGRKVAYLTVMSFLFLVIALGVVLFVPSGHPSQTASARATDTRVVAEGRS